MSFSRLIWLGVFAFLCCGCATYLPASFPASGFEGGKAEHQVVVQPAATVRVTLENGRIVVGTVIRVDEEQLVLAGESDGMGMAQEFQTSAIETVEVRTVGISDKVMFVSLAGVSALIVIVSLSTFEEPECATLTVE